MDKKLRERRRVVNRERGRRRAGWVLLAVVIVAAVGVFLWLRSSDVFAVKRITVTSTQHVTPEALKEAAGGAVGVSLLKLGLGEIEERLLALPYVRSAGLHRVFPDTLEIVVEEYQPVACVQTGERIRWLVAEDGRVLEKKFDLSLPLLVPESQLDPQPGESMPGFVVKALPITDILNDAEVRDVLPKVKAIRISPAGELTLSLEGSIEVRLGDPTELKQKLRVAGGIIQQYLRDGKKLAYVDARVPERPAAKSE